MASRIPPASGSKDLFLAKYTTAGALLWVQRVGSTGSDQVYDVAADASGNYYISGRIAGVAAFGAQNIGAASQNRCFLAKFDSSGNAVWARDVGDTDSSVTTGVAVDANGNALICGLSVSPDGPFVAKYDATGNQLWKKVQPGSSFFNENSGVTTDSAGNVYLAGRFSNTSLDFGNGVVINNPNNVILGYVAKLDSAGNALWARVAGARGFDVLAQPGGTVFVTGFYSATATNVGSEVLAPNQGGLDLFAARFDAAGNVVWVKSAGTGGNDLGRALALKSNGRLYAIGEGGTGFIVRCPDNRTHFSFPSRTPTCSSAS
jgi:hypothetical protein